VPLTAGTDPGAVGFACWPLAAGTALHGLPPVLPVAGCCCSWPLPGYRGPRLSPGRRGARAREYGQGRPGGTAL